MNQILRKWKHNWKKFWWNRGLKILVCIMVVLSLESEKWSRLTVMNEINSNVKQLYDICSQYQSQIKKVLDLLYKKFWKMENWLVMCVFQSEYLNEDLFSNLCDFRSEKQERNNIRKWFCWKTGPLKKTTLRWSSDENRVYCAQQLIWLIYHYFPIPGSVKPIDLKLLSIPYLSLISYRRFILITTGAHYF